MLAVVNTNLRKSRLNHDDYHGAQKKDVNDKFHQDPFEALSRKFIELFAKMIHLRIFDNNLGEACWLQNILVHLQLKCIFVPDIEEDVVEINLDHLPLSVVCDSGKDDIEVKDNCDNFHRPHDLSQRLQFGLVDFTVKGYDKAE